MQYYSKSLEEFRTKKSVLLETFHKTRRQISKLKTNKDIPTEKKAFIEELSRKLGLSLDALNKMEDVHTATDLLFDEQEIYLSPGEDLERLEETQKTILEAIKKIEEDYYLFLQKKPSIEEKEKNILKLDFEPQT
jgi:DNA-directed RNA polymerase specialized sigma subunit